MTGRLNSKMIRDNYLNQTGSFVVLAENEHGNR